MVDKRSSSSSSNEEEEEIESKKTNGDRGGIDNLPDSILHQVLSFLTIKQAIQTSLVSKRWRYLWESVPALNFTSRIKSKEQAFIEFVDTVLILRDNNCNIQRFSITDVKNDYDYDDYYHPAAKKLNLHLNIWIRSASRRNVEEIHLEIYFGEIVKLPHYLFTCQSLKKLELISLDSSKPTELILPDSISLPQLKTLYLQGLTLHNEDDFKINHFLSNSCPALESLTLNQCGIQAKNLNIVAPNLMHLVLNQCGTQAKNLYIVAPHVMHLVINEKDDFSKKQFLKHGGATGSVSLYAPNLISFHCKDYLSKTYCLENLSYLVEAYIDMKVRAHEKLTKRILKKGRNVMIRQGKLCRGKMINFGILHNVKHLKLSAWALQIFIATYGSSDSASTEFHNLRSLELETWLSRDCIRGITRLLNISPNVVKFSLEVIADTVSPVFPQWDEIKLNPADIGDYLKLPLHCMLDHLKIVEIRGLKGTVNELKFLEVLLKNAVVLEELIVGFSPDYLKGKCFWERQLIKYIKILHSFPRASVSCLFLIRSPITI